MDAVREHPGATKQAGKDILDAVRGGGRRQHVRCMLEPVPMLGRGPQQYRLVQLA